MSWKDRRWEFKTWMFKVEKMEGEDLVIRPWEYIAESEWRTR